MFLSMFQVPVSTLGCICLESSVVTRGSFEDGICERKSFLGNMKGCCFVLTLYALGASCL